MPGKHPLLYLLCAVATLLSGLGYAALPRQGWVMDVQPEEQTIQVGGYNLSIRGRQIVGGPLERGAFVEIDAKRITVKAPRLPLDDRVSLFPVQHPAQPGRVGFSHLRHFNALGEGQCTTCHAPEGNLTSRPAMDPSLDPTQEAHTPDSLGRFCSKCHDGVTRLAQVGVPRHRPDRTIFTAFKTAAPVTCLRCHVPKDHGDDFTLKHGAMAKRSGSTACRTCHSQDWTPEDRQALHAFLATEQALLRPPDDTRPALVVGPNNFCVYCHRTDTAWQTP